MPDVQKVGPKARQIARCRLGDLHPVVRQSAGTRAPRSSLARNAPRRMSTRPGAQGGVPGVRMCTGPDWAEPSVTRPLRTPQAEDAGALGRPFVCRPGSRRLSQPGTSGPELNPARGTLLNSRLGKGHMIISPEAARDGRPTCTRKIGGDWG